jgi:hypothetical protein
LGFLPTGWQLFFKGWWRRRGRTLILGTSRKRSTGEGEPPLGGSGHSYRRASIGFKNAALRAG